MERNTADIKKLLLGVTVGCCMGALMTYHLRKKEPKGIQLKILLTHDNCEAVLAQKNKSKGLISGTANAGGILGSGTIICFFFNIFS